MDSPAVLPELWTAEQVGRVLQRHPKTVLLLAKHGKIPSVRLGRRAVRFRPADVQRFIDEHVAEVSA